MARPLRIQFEGALYHVMARGNAQGDIFLDDADRHAFVDNLGRKAKGSGLVSCVRLEYTTTRTPAQ
jgi:hypothetical protein